MIWKGENKLAGRRIIKDDGLAKKVAENKVEPKNADLEKTDLEKKDLEKGVEKIPEKPKTADLDSKSGLIEERTKPAKML